MIEKIPFGRTGHQSTRIIFGAAALSRVTQAEADQTLEVLLRHGINHIDTANSYGASERLLGPWMPRHRDDFFLATKTEERTYAGAMEHLKRSLDLLRTDHVDLWQMHVMVKPEEWEVAMGPGGALEAFVEAKQQGLARALGVTGHGTITPSIHRRSLERYDFDAVLLPYNYPMMLNLQYTADFEELALYCRQHSVAMQTIKAITLGPWAEHAHHTHATWYEPLQEQADIDVAVHWVLGREGVFLNTVGDIHLLPRVLDAAERFSTRPSDAEMDALVERVGMAPLFV